MSDVLSPLIERSRTSDYLHYTEVGSFPHDRDEYTLPRFVFLGPGCDDDPVKIGIFAAIHGDEPEGAKALVEFLSELEADPERARGYQIFSYPVCNPTGFEDGTRHSRAGKDLNREFWNGSKQPEVYYLERELGVLGFHGVIALHSDDTVNGLYAFVRGATLTEALAGPALESAERFLPRAQDRIIDHFRAQDGLLRKCYKGVLSNPAEMKRAPFEIIFETPQLAPQHLQIKATIAALERIIAEYRAFLAHRQNI